MVQSVNPFRDVFVKTVAQAVCVGGLADATEACFGTLGASMCTEPSVQLSLLPKGTVCPPTERIDFLDLNLGAKGLGERESK